jgi:isocitrate/isopropylmalate dehydrogenase
VLNDLPTKCGLTQYRVSAALQECQKVAQDFPTVEFNSMIVDNTCMQLTGRPDQFDVMVRCPAKFCHAL